jgi:MerR family transcriptional regulator, mercuric resistance operon regulatory protein
MAKAAEGAPAPSQPIGALSRRTGCNVETIRYYEKIGLLPVPPRTEGGHRMYGPAHAMRLAFIRRARELGFRLDVVRALLELGGGRASACADARRLAASHLADVRARIADLRAMERVLAEAIRQCEAGETPGCPLIEALSAGAPA